MSDKQLILVAIQRTRGAPWEFFRVLAGSAPSGKVQIIYPVGGEEEPVRFYRLAFQNLNLMFVAGYRERSGTIDVDLAPFLTRAMENPQLAVQIASL